MKKNIAKRDSEEFYNKENLCLNELKKGSNRIVCEFLKVANHKMHLNKTKVLRL